MPSEIFPGVFVGDQADGQTWGNGTDRLLCVLEQPSQRNGVAWIPILMQKQVTFARASQLDAVAAIIEDSLKCGQRILVHCGAGIERSPLALAWWLVTSGRLKTLDEAYRLLIEKRPIVQDRRAWLEMLPKDNRA